MVCPGLIHDGSNGHVEAHFRNQVHSTSMVAVPRTMPSQALWSLSTACSAASAPMLWPPTNAGRPALYLKRVCFENARRSSTCTSQLLMTPQMKGGVVITRAACLRPSAKPRSIRGSACTRPQQADLRASRTLLRSASSGLIVKARR